MTTYTVTFPDSTTETKTTKRTLTHAISIQRADGTWKALGWSGSEAAAAKMAEADRKNFPTARAIALTTEA